METHVLQDFTQLLGDIPRAFASPRFESEAMQTHLLCRAKTGTCITSAFPNESTQEPAVATPAAFCSPAVITVSCDSCQ